MAASRPPRVLSGAVAPEAVQGVVVAGISGVDLTTATAAQISVQLPDGTEAFWSASIQSATTTTIVLLHTFSAPETVQLGLYPAVAHVTVPGGVVRAQLEPIDVVSQYAA